jgi:RimJ/RimL family protein N-acetyltransferase
VPVLSPEPDLHDSIVSLRLIDDRDLPIIERAAGQADIASRFGLSKQSPSEYLMGYQRAWAENAGAAFAISQADNKPVGQVLLEIRASGRADVGFWLLAEARGRGLATRALRLMSRWALNQPDIARLQLWTTPDNIDSQRVAERSGFKREGILRSYGAREDGSRVDAVFFSLLPSDFSDCDQRR